MKRHLLLTGALLLILCSSASAQDKPSPAMKPQSAVPPDSVLKTSARDTTGRSPQNLPKFELQQFVITGTASIDLGDAQKLAVDDRISMPELVNPVSVPRDRSTVEFLNGPKLSSVQDLRRSMSGRLLGSVGTYLTSQFGLWLSLRDADKYVFGDAHYGSARAYLPFANHSEGHVGVKGGMTLSGPSEWYDRAALEGGIGFGSRSYRFFGSSTPSITRTASQFDFSADFSSAREAPARYDGTAGMSVTSISDSSSSVTETRFDAGIGYGFLLGSVPIESRVGLSLVSNNGSGGPTLPFFDGGIKTRKIWMGDLFLQGAGQFYVTQGMVGQKLARFYPQLELGYRFLESSTASVAYLGHVNFNSLAGLLQIHPYLSAASIIRQSDVPVDLLAVIETGWSERVRTRVSARYQSMRDYPLFTEGGMKGFWTTAYLGTTELSTFQADLFAKFAANSYFTLSLAANSSRNSSTNWKIPYIPDVQLDASASLGLLEKLSIVPTLSVVDRRVSDLYATTRMKAYVLLGLRGEYSLMRFMEVFVDFRNLTNSNYDAWNGYRATPFVASAGLTLHW